MSLADGRMQERMAEATRLTREGRLAEATAAIQNALGGRPAPKADARSEAPWQHASSWQAPTGNALRPAPGAPTARRPRRPSRTRGLPEGLPGVAPHTPPGGGPLRGAPERGPAATPGGGRFVERSYANRAGTRDYKLYLPSGCTGQKLPLVVMLHGCTQDPDDFAAGTRMNTLAEEHTFLVAYPAQAGNANMQKCWNWFKAGDQRRGGGEPSILAGITCEVVGEYGADPDRVYVAGMSAGGAMAAILGAAYPDIYAAVGVHSGLPPGEARDLPSAFAAMQGAGSAHPNGAVPNDGAAEPGGPLPLIVFHGDRDTTVHPSNADRLVSSHVRAVPGSVANGSVAPIEVRQGRAPGGHAYTCATHRDARGLAAVEQWTVHGLGHAWSGGTSAGSHTDPKGPDASAEMARFFSEHRRS